MRRFPDYWELVSAGKGPALAYTHGENHSDDRPLAQMPPLELRTGLAYTATRWSGVLLWRLVAEQDRYAVKQGNIVGQDLLFDKVYAEHLSRSGAMIADFD